MSMPATATSSSTATTSSAAALKPSTAASSSAAAADKPASSYIVSAAELAPQSAAGSSAPAPPPLPSEPTRLWVGNIGPRVAEYQLLRLAQPAGTITKFDFMLHGAGPQAGRPRGYAFVSYSTHREAQVGLRRLDGALLLGARLVCRWAHEQALPGDAPVKREEPAAAPAPPPSGAATRPKLSAESQIRAIEMKLQRMTDGGDEGARFAVKADSERTDVHRLPRVRGPLSWVNAPGKHAAQQAKPYARKRY